MIPQKIEQREPIYHGALDSNSILVAAMKNRTSGEMIRAYQELIDRLRSAGIKPKRHILDNECSEDFKRTILKNDMKF
jgi:hypothetical protein